MDKEKLLEEVQRTDYISGIYNYCDRWCERCIFNVRCISYAMEQEKFAEPESRNMDNQLFWDKLSETFRETKELLYKTANKQGISVNDLDTSQGDELHDISHAYAENHPVAKAARAYSNMVTNWFKEIDHLFSISYNEKKQCLIAIPTNTKPEIRMEDISNAVSVIRWYQFQISVKLMRALNGVILEENEDMWIDTQKDSDGSAKVSLIGIDFSIAGWGTLLKNYPTEENTILDILVYLEKLKKDVEFEFPEAWDFIRPGFDDEPGY